MITLVTGTGDVDIFQSDMIIFKTPLSWRRQLNGCDRDDVEVVFVLQTR